MNRVTRLRDALLDVPAETLRAGVRHIPEDAIRVQPAAARPLANQLKRAQNPADLLRRVPNPNVVALVADQVSDECLEVTRTILGDAADDPTREQLVEAIDKVLELFDVPIVRVMLATVAIADAEASDLCDELLDTDERFALAPTSDAPGPTTERPVRSGPSEEVLAKRRERKEAKKAAKGSGRATPPKHKRAQPPAAPRDDADDKPPHVPIATRRAAAVPPGFDAAHPLAGSVVITVVPFDAEVGAKTRPCVVVGVSDDELLVRPCYSEGGMQSRRWQSYALRDWAAAGLTKPSFVEPDTTRVARGDVGDVVGRISDDDWNALV